MTIKKSNWAEELKGVYLILMNNYPDIVHKCKAWEDEPYQKTLDCDDVYQWYIADIDDRTAEKIKERTMGEIEFYYSDLLDQWILPVLHFGTPWAGVPVKVKED